MTSTYTISVSVYCVITIFSILFLAWVCSCFKHEGSKRISERSFAVSLEEGGSLNDPSVLRQRILLKFVSRLKYFIFRECFSGIKCLYFIKVVGFYVLVEDNENVWCYERIWRKNILLNNAFYRSHYRRWMEWWIFHTQKGRFNTSNWESKLV